MPIENYMLVMGLFAEEVVEPVPESSVALPASDAKFSKCVRVTNHEQISRYFSFIKEKPEGTPPGEPHVPSHYKMRPRQTVAAEFGHPAWDIPRCIFRSVFCAAYGSSSQCNFARSEEHTSELQSLTNLVCRLLLEKKKNK